MKSKRWGRTLSIIYSVAKLVLVVLATIAQISMFTTMLGDPSTAQNPDETARFVGVFIGTLIAGVCLGTIYVVLLGFMFCPNVVHYLT